MRSITHPLTRLCLFVAVFQWLLFGLCALVACAGSLVSSAAIDYLVPGFRPPSIPLIVLNPTMSMWVNANTLTDDYARHWSGSTMTCSGMARIDGTAYRFLGPKPTTASSMTQHALHVTPTRTIAVFQAGGVQLTVTFAQTAFPDNLDYYTRPYAYITIDVVSVDSATHTVQVYFDHASDVLINSEGQLVDWLDMSGAAGRGTYTLRMGQYDQIPFINRGDATKNESAQRTTHRAHSTVIIPIAVLIGASVDSLFAVVASVIQMGLFVSRLQQQPRHHCRPSQLPCCTCRIC